ncbi:MAG: EF-hand domain-containing protein [Planctomycetota bacterium]|nr:EF-hand domain-containing protein [Planctomycetota bacterium]
MNSIRACALLVACGTVVSAASAQTLTCVGRVDLFNAVVANIGGSPNPNRIGTNPSACALVGNDLYVAGYNNSGSAMNCQVLKIPNWQTTQNNPSFVQLPGAGRSVPSFFSYTGMSYNPSGGLLVTFNNYGFGGADQMMRFDVSGATPVKLAGSPDGTLQGSCGPAWDAGVDGNGYTYAGGSGPVPVAMFFGEVGPFGLNPSTLDASIGATVWEYGTPSDWNLRLDFTGISGTTWRDVDVSPLSGTYVARANNDLVIGQRTNNKNFSTQVLVDGGNFPFVDGQNVSILAGFPGGDLVVYNDHPNSSGGQNPLSVIKFVDLAGNAVNVTLDRGVIPAGGDFLNPSIGFYDFSWDVANKRLCILDFSDYYAYIFEIPNACAADFNGDGFLDFTDFDAFVVSFELGEAKSDFNGDGFLDFTDFDAFVTAFETGC